MPERLMDSLDQIRNRREVARAGIPLLRLSLMRQYRSDAGRLWPLLLPVFLLLPGMLAFPFPSAEAAYSDLALTHYPYAIFIRQSLAEYASLPLWSPVILSGAPLAANPLASLWYPPAWLTWLFPLPFSFNLLVCLHLVFGGLGVYCLARAEGLAHPAALFAGLSFEMLPKLFAHYGAGHLTLLYALPWTPWLLLAFRRDMGASRGSFPGLWSAAVLALIFLADVRWAAYAGLLWLVYVLSYWSSLSAGVSQLKPPHSSPSPKALPVLLPSHPALPSLLSMVMYLIRQLLQACLLALPLAVPFLVFIRQSSRLWMESSDFLVYSLPPERLLGLLYPDFGGFHEFTLYPGAIVLALALLALLWGAALRRVRYWAVILLLAVLFSLGEAVPGLTWLSLLPMLGLLRVPARALFLAGLAMIFLAANALDSIQKGISNVQIRSGGFLLVVLVGFALAMLPGIWLVTGALSSEFLWGGLAMLLSAIWLGLGMAKRLPATAWLAGLFALVLLDLGFVDLTLFSPRPAAQVLSEGANLAKDLAQEREQGLFRIYSPSFSLPQSTAAYYSLELADGVDPMQIGGYVQFMQLATGVPVEGYSVTLPPFGSNNPQVDNAAYLPDAQLLGLLNVRYVASSFDLLVDGLQLVRHYGQTRLYENQRALPRAWIQPAELLPGVKARAVDSLDWRPNRITVTAQGPGTLVLSEIDYPGWRLQVDGEKRVIQRYAGVLRSVQLDQGQHQVVFSYFPVEIWSSLLVQGVYLLGLLLTWWSHKVHKLSPDAENNHQAKQAINRTEMAAQNIPIQVSKAKLT